MKKWIPVLLIFALLSSGFTGSPVAYTADSAAAESADNGSMDESALGQLPVLEVTDGTTTTIYTLADANYEYQSTYVRIYRTYGSYVMISASVPLDQQICPFEDGTVTWDEFIKDYAEQNLIERAAIMNAATKAGYTELTEEEQAQIDSVMETYAATAVSFGFVSLDEYLSAYYGPGNNEQTVRSAQREQLICSRYLRDLYDGFSYTDEELDACYEEHADEWNVVYSLITTLPAETNVDIPLAMSRGLSITTASWGNEEEFRRRVEEETGAPPAEVHDSAGKFIQTFSDAFPGKVSEGYPFVSKATGEVTVGYVQRVEDNRYSTVNVRHILVMTEDTNGDGVYSEEEKQAAFDAVKAIEEEWLAGEATEESFASLAAEKSADQGSLATGGLYENIFKGQMVPEFDEFCFAGHERGDTAIVYGQSSAYEGYHLIYFVGETGQLRSRQLADEELRSEGYNSVYAELLAPYTAKRTFFWDFIMNT